MAKDPIELLKKLVADACPPLPGKSVYGIFVRNESWYSGSEHLIYLGSSKNVEKRRSSKKHPYSICLERFNGKMVFLKCFLSDDHIEDEKILISFFKPVMNKQYTRHG